jgi:glycosyltransferase involved in cell wall biosynthesis
MKINLIFFLPTFTFGGDSNSIYRLCSNLDKKKYNIFIISIGKCYVKKKLKKHCRNIFELKTKRTLFSIFMLRNIVSNIYKNFPQKTIFVSNHHYANIVSLIALKSYKHIKIVLVDRADLKEAIGYYNLINFFKGLIIYFLVPIFYKSADAIVTNSKSAKVDLQRLCKKKVINISPPSLLKFLSKKNKKNKKKIYTVITVGSLVKPKGVDTMIKAFNKIKLNNVILKVLGDGKEKNNLEKMIHKYGLEKKVFLLGRIKNTKKIYESSDLFIHASHQEGFPNAIVEAINYNLPVICSDCKGGTKEIILNGKGGDLFPIRNHNILANKINAFFKNQKPLMKKLALARNNIKKFTLKNNVKKYDKLFSGL